MAFTAQQVIDRALVILQDAPGDHWLPTDLVQWINDALVDLAKHNDRVGATEGAIPLVAGARQRLPTGGIRLLDVYHNIPSYLAVRPGDVIAMDAFDPAWRSASASDVVMYERDASMPDRFEVYPAQPASTTGSLQARYVAFPPQVGALTTDLTLPDDFLPVVVDYVLWRAFSEDAEFNADPSKAKLFMEAYQQAAYPRRAQTG